MSPAEQQRRAGLVAAALAAGAATGRGKRNSYDQGSGEWTTHHGSPDRGRQNGGAR